jgi:hypothetical protein
MSFGGYAGYPVMGSAPMMSAPMSAPIMSGYPMSVPISMAPTPHGYPMQFPMMQFAAPAAPAAPATGEGALLSPQECAMYGVPFGTGARWKPKAIVQDQPTEYGGYGGIGAQYDGNAYNENEEAC